MDTAAATNLSVSVALEDSTGMEEETRVVVVVVEGEKEEEEKEEEEGWEPPTPRPPLLPAAYSLGRDQAP